MSDDGTSLVGDGTYLYTFAETPRLQNTNAENR